MKVTMPPLPEWVVAQQKKQAECPHRHTKVTVIVSTCQECGVALNHVVKDRLADLTTLIHQGTVDLDTILQAHPDLTEEGQERLRQVSPCHHSEAHREVSKCVHSGYRERCQACGRVFASPSQWILNQEATNGT